MPTLNYDPFGRVQPETLFGFNLIVAPEIPRYKLPDEVIPGVPWPADFKAEIDAWALKVCGTVCFVPEGIAFVQDRNNLWVTKRTYAAIKLATTAKQFKP